MRITNLQNDLKFSHLQIGDTFKICSPRSTGAVYLKCRDYHENLGMLEFTTGTVFPPTNSNVQKVDVELTILN